MIPVYQVDAFCTEPFKGNPAAVVLLEAWMEDEILQNIAAEFNLSETAFVVKNEREFELRWFTPIIEVRLCGHATLAGAHVIFEHTDFTMPQIIFSTKWVGELIVRKEGDAYLMDFPADQALDYHNPELEGIIGTKIQEYYKGKDDIMLVLPSESDVQKCCPNLNALKKLDTRALIVTAVGNDVDFVSRVFAPACGIDEDPVTGSAHTLMTPYWSNRFAKDELKARQISKRSGDLICRIQNDRVLLTGSAVTLLSGTMNI